MIGGVAAAATLDRDGTWAPSEIYVPTPPAGVRALVPDGSFEFGPPPGSGWVEVSSQPCEWIANWTSVWGVGPYHGGFDYWAGGYCYGLPTSSSVTQQVTVDPTNCTLSFWFLCYRPDVDDVPGDGDHAYVKVNGVEVWTRAFTQANNTYPNWVNATVVIPAGSVSLAFGADSFGSATGNIRFDYIELLPCGPTSADDVSWGTLKTLYR